MVRAPTALGSRKRVVPGHAENEEQEQQQSTHASTIPPRRVTSLAGGAEQRERDYAWLWTRRASALTTTTDATISATASATARRCRSCHPGGRSRTRSP